MIREATLADIPSIMELERSCASAAHWSEQQYQQIFQHGLDGPQRLALVAEELVEDSSMDGFLVALHLAPEWELENIVVAPAARRRGIGKRLLDALLQKARETNSTSVFLEVRESNRAARNLYEKAGFEPSGRRKSYYANPSEDAVLYRHTLG